MWLGGDGGQYLVVIQQQTPQRLGQRTRKGSVVGTTASAEPLTCWRASETGTTNDVGRSDSSDAEAHAGRFGETESARPELASDIRSPVEVVVFAEHRQQDSGALSVEPLEDQFGRRLEADGDVGSHCGTPRSLHERDHLLGQAAGGLVQGGGGMAVASNDKALTKGLLGGPIHGLAHAGTLGRLASVP